MMTIYSVGDIWYLGKVLDAIAMVTGADGGLKQASAVAALLGVIIICFQSVIRNQGINIQHMVVCYIIYMMCFGFTTSVAIESAYSDKQVIQKDNVPYGPAVMGYVVSQLGYKLTRKMEQAFQDIDDNQKMTNQGAGGYLNALYLIENLGRIAEDGTIARAINAVDPDFQSNFLRYTSECTLKGMYYGSSRGGMDWQILQTKGVWDAIFFDSDWYTTEFRNHGGSEVLNCTDAHGKLKKQWDNAIVELQSGKASDEVKNIAMRLGQCNSKGECSNQSDFLVKTDSDALKTLFNAQTKAQDFVLAGYADNLIKTGLADGFTFMGNANSAAMMLQAINQRQTQWAAEQNMFLKSMRPMMSFVEGFFYAIAPFASIILMLGLLGLNIFFKYLILLVWVQLWLPVMSIANMFISVRANAFLSNLPIPKDGSSSTVSLYVYETAIDGVREYIASGAMFMAATPLLTFIIISGSAYAMTSLTGRMSGGDFVNEKMVSPDIAEPAAAMGMKSTFNGNPTTGAWRDGISREIDIREGLNSVRSSLDSQLESSMSGFKTASGKAVQSLFEHGQTNATNQINQAGTSYFHSDSGAQAYANARNIAQSATDTSGWSEQDYTDFATGLSARFLGNGASADSGIKKSLSANAQTALTKLDNSGRSFSKSEIASLTEAKSAILSKALNNTDGIKDSASINSSMQKEGANVKNLTQQYNKVDSASKAFSNGFKVKNIDLVGNALRANEGKTLKLLDDLVNEGSLQSYVDAKMKYFGRQGAEGVALSKFEAIAQNNKELAGRMYLGLLENGGYNLRSDFLDLSKQVDRNKGIVNSNEVGPQTVGFNQNKFDTTKNLAETNAAKATIDNINNEQTTQSGDITTKGINKIGDIEQKNNEKRREENTDRVNNSPLYKSQGFDLNRAGLSTRAAYEFAKKYIDTSSSFFKDGDFNGASKEASKSFSEKFNLGKTNAQQTLADILGGHSVINSETKSDLPADMYISSNGQDIGFNNQYSFDKQQAQSILDKKAHSLESYIAKDLSATTKLTDDEAKDRAKGIVSNLRNYLNEGNEQGVFSIINEVKGIRSQM